MEYKSLGWNRIEAWKIKLNNRANRSIFFSGILPIFGLLAAFFVFFPTGAWADDALVKLPGLSVTLDQPAGDGKPLATGLKILLLLTVLSVAPAFLIVMTSFTRIVIVLSMLRHAIGMQQTPPNTVIISLALFLTAFSMMPVFNEIYHQSYKPYVEEAIGDKAAFDLASKSMAEFMVKHTREQDLVLMSEIAHQPIPQSIDDLKSHLLVPAFMLSELKAAFQIGFVIFLPFLLIDIIVAAILMSMGMLMVPPMMISMPVKILMFVLIDGWNLVVSSLMSSLM
jgi:flagellar biosynthesis protein FliP